MVYYSNGGFNWNDLYYMPTKLREFYWRELLEVKKKEQEDLDKAKKPKQQSRFSRK
jgi:hypothetical protein